ncbi:hypothetical protein GQ44DRAFT_723996 [Phaeosphaeriaceae sp. PMI808]|nr:hypothetical protein GQ44DRAFT_723996 [Phaeosphaeriaceae sp. PMI808]
MTPPKRGVFSLNFDSTSDHYERISEEHLDGTNTVKVFNTKGPSHSHTDVSYVTKPFEKIVNQTVNDVIEGTGKKVHSIEGDIHYTNDQESSSTLSIKNKAKKRALERKYDTSEL